MNITAMNDTAGDGATVSTCVTLDVGYREVPSFKVETLAAGVRVHCSCHATRQLAEDTAEGVHALYMKRHEKPAGA